MPDKRGIAVGLTGNICSGKTTVLNLFMKLGCRTLSMDQVAHDLLYNPAIKKKIIGYFGRSITNEYGGIDRSKLANIVFRSAAKRKKLEDVLHPAIIAEAGMAIEKAPEGSIIIIEAPLLFETGWYKKVDYYIMVACPMEIRRKRFYSDQKNKHGDFERRDKTQWNESKKTGLSTYIIDNSKNLGHTVSQVLSILKTLRQKTVHAAGA